jgi:hypothetical protein
MLSESERRSLDEIESQFRVEEPALDNALAAGKPRGRTSTAIAVVFGSIGLFLLFMGSFGPALACFGMVSLALMLRGFTWR